MITLDTIKKHLQLYGYTIRDNDTYLLNHFKDEIEEYILNYCNIKSIPEKLRHVELDLICGEFLKFKKRTGGLVDENGNPWFTGLGDVESVKVGDVDVSLDGGDLSSLQNGFSEDEFDALIDDLCNREDKEHILNRFRVIWDGRRTY